MLFFCTHILVLGDGPSSVEEAGDHASLHVLRVVRREIQVTVRVSRLSVYTNFNGSVILPVEKGVQEW